MNLKNRPLSWSAISSFEYDKEQWARKYLDNIKEPPNPAMIFGSMVGESIAQGNSPIPVTRLSHFEYKLEATLNKIPLIGYVDSYEPHTKLLEYKTSQKDTTWSQKKVDEHGQLTFYALMLFLQHGINPKDIHFRLEYIPVRQKNDFIFEWTGQAPTGWDTKRSLQDILKFGNYVVSVVADMKAFAKSREKSIM